MRNQLTPFALFNIPRCDGKDRKHLSHDVHNDICHFFTQWDMDVGLEASEEAFHSSKYVNECVFTSGNILSRLRDLGVKIPTDEERRYSPRGGRQLQRRLLSQVRIPV